LEWRGCNSVEGILTEAVTRLVNADAEKVGRLVRKLKDRWSGRILLVLDGVSERNALPAAQNILQDLILKHKGACRLLFTTRPLEAAAGYEKMLWTHCSRINVEPFDDEELDGALAQAHIPPAEISDNLRSIARIPRYFATCLKLRSSLRQFGNLSVALVLWRDLLDRIDGLEPAIREALGFKNESDAVDVLVKLASGLPEAVATDRAQQLLNSCFDGKYAEVRNYLKELRIMDSAGKFEATLSRHHTTLGRALLLRQVLGTDNPLGVREAADRLLGSSEKFVLRMV